MSKQDLIVTKCYKPGRLLYLHSVEFALYAMYRPKDEKGASVLQSRLRNTQKSGIPLNRKPGRGTRSGYSEEEMIQIFLCFMLMELGISNARAAQMVKFFVDNGEKAPLDIPDFMSYKFKCFREDPSLLRQQKVHNDDKCLIYYGGMEHEMDTTKNTFDFRIDVINLEDIVKELNKGISYQQRITNLDQASLFMYLSLSDAAVFEDNRKGRYRPREIAA